jgi:hypothetical protein
MSEKKQMTKERADELHRQMVDDRPPSAPDLLEKMRKLYGTLPGEAKPATPAPKK